MHCDIVLEFARRLVRRRMQALACMSSRLPSLMVMENVVRKSTDVWAQGAFADVYEGEYNGDDVAIKHLRAFNASTVPIEKGKKVRLSLPPKYHGLSLPSYYIERLSCGSMWTIKTS